MNTLKQYWKFFVSVITLILALFVGLLAIFTYVFESENTEVDPDGVFVPEALVDGFQNLQL